MSELPRGGMDAWREQGSRKAAYAASVPTLPGGNTDWARAYAAEIRQLIHRQAARAPRSVQSHLGPSELGVQCHRNVVGKMVAVIPTNHIPSPWPSILGTAAHAWLAQALQDENARIHMDRFISELAVAPVPEHAGTTDFYDRVTQTVGDWKVLAPTSMAKIASAGGPPRVYRVQLLLYWLGCLNAGLPAKRIALIALPRAAATLDGMYVWSHEPGPEDAALIADVLRETTLRRHLATEILARRMTLEQVPITPGDDCFYCLDGDTAVVTRDGIKPIRELAGTSPELLVPRQGKNPGLAAHGDFAQAPVRAFGEQRLWEIQLSKQGAEKTVYATAEHRWLLAKRPSRANPDNKYGRILQNRVIPDDERFERTTQQLKPGDRLRGFRAAKPVADLMPWAVAQGFVFGDGTRGQGNRPATLSIYDNGKDEALLPFFPFTEPKQYAGVKHIYGLPRFWKDLPPIRESRAFLLSWLAGYFAADGCVGKEGRAQIHSAEERNILFVRDVAAVCGIGYCPPRSSSRLGFGTEPTALWSISLRRQDLPGWFFLIKEHAIRSSRAILAGVHDTGWTVKSVQATDRTETVYCATVPGAGMFGLADDLLTGNCLQFRPQAARDLGPGCAGTSIGQGSL